VAAGVGLCERCNPLGLRDSAASQAHGTAFFGVVVAVIALAVVARLAVAGAGPFPASVDAVVPAGDGLAVTLTVVNEGSATGQTTCRLTDPTDRGISASAILLSPRIEAGESETFTGTVSEFGSVALPLQVECRSS
jgi:hypothetical protein